MSDTYLAPAVLAQRFAPPLVAIAVAMRMMRSSMIETLSEEYIRFLRAKGLSRRSVLFGHALKFGLKSTNLVLKIVRLSMELKQVFVSAGFELFDLCFELLD